MKLDVPRTHVKELLMLQMMAGKRIRITAEDMEDKAEELL